MKRQAVFGLLIALCIQGCSSGERSEPRAAGGTGSAGRVQEPGEKRAAVPDPSARTDQAATPNQGQEPAAGVGQVPPQTPPASQPQKEVAPSPPGELPLEYLRQFVGQYPRDVDLWRSVPFAVRAYKLVGAERYQVLLVNMQTQQPIGAENGTVYVLGTKMLAGATDAAAIVADPKNDLLYIWLKVAGEVQEYREGGKPVLLPRAVQAAIAGDAG